MNLLVLLTVFFPFLCLGSGLKCYVCEAGNASICNKGNPHLREVDCGLEDTTFFWFCLNKVTFNTKTHKYNHRYSCERMGRPAIFKNLPQCKLKEFEELLECRVCLTNLCAFPNSLSSRATSSYFLILMLVLFNFQSMQ